MIVTEEVKGVHPGILPHYGYPITFYDDPKTGASWFIERLARCPPLMFGPFTDTDLMIWTAQDRLAYITELVRQVDMKEISWGIPYDIFAHVRGSSMPLDYIVMNVDNSP